MSEREALFESFPQKGERVRLTRTVVATKGGDLVKVPAGSLGTVTVSLDDHVLFAKFAGGDMELLEGEYERA